MDDDPVADAGPFEGADIDGESLTVLLVAGGSTEAVLRVLGAETEVEKSDDSSPDLDDVDWSAYAVAGVSGGVVAFEHTGYADPSLSVLAALSALGGAAAVTRSNIQAHERFGCAREGVLVFDADEFMYVEENEKAAVPQELRPLFDSAWIDLGSDDAADDDDAAGWVGYAMAALFTGLAVSPDDLHRAIADGYHRVRSQTYLE